MEKTSKLYQSIIIFLKGIFMGSADIIPGVSGGTIALITGIYERLVKGISNIRFGFVVPFFKGEFKKSWEILLEEIDFALFIPLLLGIALAFLTLSKVIVILLNVYPEFTFAFFLGLILSSAYFVYTHTEGISVKTLVFLVIGAIFGYVFVGLNPIAANHSLPILFISGAIAIMAMILPGISGSFILLILNQYEHMLAALNSLNIVEIITFIAGAVIGILGFSKLLNYLIDNYKSVTMSFLVGLMLGTLKLPFDKIVANINLTSTTAIIGCVVLAIIGFLIVFIMEKKFGQEE